MAIKITHGERSTLILRRNKAVEYEQYIAFVSSTEPQPFCAINFDNGLPVGGRPMSQRLLDALLSKAEKLGSIIEGETP